MILESLLTSQNIDCVRESKKLLAKTLLQFEDKKDIARQYLEELYSEKKDIKLAVELMTLSTDLGDLKSANKYYKESIALIENGAKFNLTLLNYLYFASLVYLKSTFDEAMVLFLKLITDFKKIGILDYHFLVTRNLPSFYDFLKKVEQLYLDNGKKFELIEFLKSELQWVDESGKKVINEILTNHNLKDI
ncbi:MAG: hypothetical protein HQK53_12210 [Oligoflexia bacterium]|nr:hypothetical protein [Oligoflexia bacterium]